MSQQAAAADTVCRNCGEPLAGAFCQARGQKAAGPDVSLHDFSMKRSTNSPISTERSSRRCGCW
jgi:hypothetical protein